MSDYERIIETTTEDIIFIIYYGIITLSLIANQVERNYLKYKDPKDKENLNLSTKSKQQKDIYLNPS